MISSMERGSATTSCAGNEIPIYRAFWEENLQKMEEISSRIERTLIRLEKKYLHFQESYDELTGSIDLLLSIYSSYNNLGGVEYLLRLKACITEYRRRYSHEGVRFNVLYHLHAKVKEMRNGGFAAFPRVRHRMVEKASLPSPEPGFIATYRWITFGQNRARFVTPYDTVDILRADGAEVYFKDDAGQYCLAVKGVHHPVRELIPRQKTGAKEKTEWYILVRRGETASCYAAAERGRRILARKDIIGMQLKRYGQSERSYVRLFGRNHIYLDT